eukprot:2215774-Pyramimonas_sp.AAC.1
MQSILFSDHARSQSHSWIGYGDLYDLLCKSPTILCKTYYFLIRAVVVPVVVACTDVVRMRREMIFMVGWLAGGIDGHR